MQLSNTWYKKGMGGVWCFRLYWVDWSITDVLYVHNITLACRDRDYAENTIQTFHKEGMPGTSNYLTSSSKSWDARVHGAVDDPPKTHPSHRPAYGRLLHIIYKQPTPIS